ncbi:DeoR/GlpR family DNA-binding transcription regulator [bacterium]|nr:DeoR/GlpR family DNA-binding transcription regulator [bacterium]
MKSQSGIPAKRQNQIYQLLKDKGIVQVGELAALLDVAEMTVRRDLEALEKRGLAERTHGGAIFNDHMRAEPHIAQKRAVHREEKAAIGALAATLIEPGDTVFVNSGSTTLPWAPIEVPSTHVEVIMIGGELRRESFSIVGDSATQMVRQVFATKAVLGVDGISALHGVTNPIQAEAGLNRLMIEQTHGEVIIVADSSKIGRISNFLTAPISAIDTIVTDDGIDPDYLEELRRQDVRVLIAPAVKG